MGGTMAWFLWLTGTADAAPEPIEGEVPAGAHHLLRVSMLARVAGATCRTLPRQEVSGAQVVRRVPLLGDGVATEFTVTMPPDAGPPTRCEHEVVATVELGPVSAGRWSVRSSAPEVAVAVVPVVRVPVVPPGTLTLDRPQRVGVTLSTGSEGTCVGLSAVGFTQEGHTLRAHLEAQPPVALACGIPTRTTGTASLELAEGTWTIVAEGATLEGVDLVMPAP